MLVNVQLSAILSALKKVAKEYTIKMNNGLVLRYPVNEYEDDPPSFNERKGGERDWSLEVMQKSLASTVPLPLEISPGETRKFDISWVSDPSDRLSFKRYIERFYRGSYTSEYTRVKYFKKTGIVFVERTRFKKTPRKSKKEV